MPGASTAAGGRPAATTGLGEAKRLRAQITHQDRQTERCLRPLPRLLRGPRGVRRLVNTRALDVLWSMKDGLLQRTSRARFDPAMPLGVRVAL